MSFYPHTISKIVRWFNVSRHYKFCTFFQGVNVTVHFMYSDVGEVSFGWIKRSEIGVMKVLYREDWIWLYTSSVLSELGWDIANDRTISATIFNVSRRHRFTINSRIVSEGWGGRGGVWGKFTQNYTHNTRLLNKLSTYVQIMSLLVFYVYIIGKKGKLKSTCRQILNLNKNVIRL